MDYVSVMTYDYHGKSTRKCKRNAKPLFDPGKWDQVTGINSPLYDSQDEDWKNTVRAERDESVRSTRFFFFFVFVEFFHSLLDQQRLFAGETESRLSLVRTHIYFGEYAEHLDRCSNYRWRRRT